jgi:cytochrome c553
VKSLIAVPSLLATLVLAITTPVAAQQAGSTFVVPAWAFPTNTNPIPPQDSVVKERLPGSRFEFTMKRAREFFDIVDWIPESHSAMPPIVQKGVLPTTRACGSCHLPNGAGRPENATLAGLPQEYFLAQIAALRDSTRWHANPAKVAHSMYLTASRLTDADARIAADYFAKQKLTRRNRIIEADRVPKTEIEGVVYLRLAGDSTEPLAGRLIEFPEDSRRHLLRDPNVQYLTYVPRGSLERGEDLVTNGPAGPASACGTCHGPDLRGVGAIPPLAGRSPSNILRQLINFRTGARHEPGSQLMMGIAGYLALDDMIALSAYIGSLAP